MTLLNALDRGKHLRTLDDALAQSMRRLRRSPHPNPSPEGRGAQGAGLATIKRSPARSEAVNTTLAAIDLSPTVRGAQGPALAANEPLSLWERGWGEGRFPQRTHHP